jgi:hypothetical protein
VRVRVRVHVRVRVRVRVRVVRLTASCTVSVDDWFPQCKARHGTLQFPQHRLAYGALVAFSWAGERLVRSVRFPPG